MKTHRGWIIVIVLMSAMAAKAGAQSGSKTLGVVNGETITEEQVSKAAARELEGLELKRLQSEATQKRETQEAMEKALNSLLQEKLMAAEAAKRKVSEDALIEQIENAVKMPSGPEIEAWYEQNKDRIPIPREEALPQIGPYLMEQKKGEAREAFFEKLKKDYTVKTFLEPLRMEIPTAGYPTRGPANASVTIVEFSDFQCPFCGALYPVLKDIEKKYPETVRVVYRQFPLVTIHPDAQKSAEASLCANEQQRFWEFHDSLFNNQKELGVSALKGRASELKLNTTAFNECLDSGRTGDAIRKDIVDGYKAGVTGTPAVYINGRPYRSESTTEAIAKVIDDELQRKAAK